MVHGPLFFFTFPAFLLVFHIVDLTFFFGCIVYVLWVFLCMQLLLLFSTTLRKHAYSNILKILPPKNENFQIKNSDIFVFLLKT